MKSTVVSLLGSLSVKAALSVSVITFIASGSTQAQLLSFSKQDLVDYTAQEPFDRLPDGRPKVPKRPPRTGAGTFLRGDLGRARAAGLPQSVRRRIPDSASGQAHG